MSPIDDATLTRMETRYASGLSSADILDVFATHGIQLTEATLRKYVQLGLLPRSVRVGKKGKHQGSRGLYPVGVIRRFLRIREMMADNFTIEEIRRDFLFMRSDIEQLGRTLDAIFATLSRVARDRRREGVAHVVTRDVDEARALSRDLMARLGTIESKLTTRSKLHRVAAV